VQELPVPCGRYWLTVGWTNENSGSIRSESLQNDLIIAECGPLQQFPLGFT
jgi:hypothetical protein